MFTTTIAIETFMRLPKKGDEEVGENVTLMNLVQDDVGVSDKVGILLHPLEDNTRGAVENGAVIARGRVIQPDLVPDGGVALVDLLATFLCHPLGH